MASAETDLPEPGLSDDGHHLAGIDRIAQALDGAHGAVRRHELHVQVVDLDDGTRRKAAHSRCRGLCKRPVSEARDDLVVHPDGLPSHGRPSFLFAATARWLPVAFCTPNPCYPTRAMQSKRIRLYGDRIGQRQRPMLRLPSQVTAAVRNRRGGTVPGDRFCFAIAEIGKHVLRQPSRARHVAAQLAWAHDGGPHDRQHLVPRRQSSPAGRLRQPAHRRPARVQARPHLFHGRRQGLHRERDLLLPRHRRCRRAGPTAPSRAGRRASCASPPPTSWPSPTTTATACSRASAICSRTRTSACCSSTCTASRAACASTARRRSRATIRCSLHTVGAQLIVRVTASAIFPNCPRYIPKLELVEPSIYTPKPGCDPVEPAWKGFDAFKDAVHPRQPTARGDGRSATPRTGPSGDKVARHR